MKRIGYVLLLALPLGCDFPGQPNPKDKFVSPSKQADFWKLYNKNCRGCHGEDGTLGPAPPLRDQVFLTIVPRDELLKVIAEGRRGTSMPAFAMGDGGTLTHEQVEILVKGLTGELWSNKFTPAKGEWPDYLPPAEKGDVARGKSLFAKACAQCHGENGAGTKTMGPINNPAFLNLSTEQFFRRIIITGRSDLGMPNCMETTGRPADFTALTGAEINDIVALIASWKNPSAK